MLQHRIFFQYVLNFLCINVAHALRSCQIFVVFWAKFCQAWGAIISKWRL